MRTNGSTIASRILNLKETIEENERKQIEVQTQLQMQEKRLKEQFGCSSIQEARKFLKEKEKKMDKLQVQLERELDVLEKEVSDVTSG